MRKALAVTLAVTVIATAAIGGTALAWGFERTVERFEYQAEYKLDGQIMIKKRAGHGTSPNQVGTTGAELEQIVEGDAELLKKQKIRIARYIMAYEQDMDWEVPADALEGLSVITTIRLCARPMSAAEHSYLPITAATSVYICPEIIDHIRLNDPYFFVKERPLPFDISPEVASILDIDNRERSIDGIVYEFFGYEINEGDIINPYHPLVVSGAVEVGALTEQVWSSWLITDPGEEGAFQVDYTAAYGPGPYEKALVDSMLGPGVIHFYNSPYLWWFDDTKEDGIYRGNRYVGNYFDIEQFAYVSGGTMKRFISLSNPFDYLYFEEKYDVEGMSMVREALSMKILEPGEDAVRFDWLEMF